eukprot:RCo021262
MASKNRGPKAPPPILRPVAREDSVEKMGVLISENGTLQIELVDGKQIAVRPMGVAAFPQTADPNSGGASSETGPPELLGKIQWTDLKIGHVIGEGAQGKVRKVKHRKTGVIYALKIITLGKSVTKRTLQQELSRVLTMTNHDNVVTSVEAFYIDGALKILMEYMDLGTLQSIVKQIGLISEEALSAITKQILEGLSYLHASAIVHRDIKPTNLLVNSQGFVKISDFGVSTFVNSVNPFAQTLIGSTAYMSPERVRAEKYDAKSDIWSVGLTVAQCALGVYPFFTETAEEAASQKNPFERKVNMFDLAALIAESRAKVDFDVLVPKIVRFYPDRPKPEVSPELVDFVQQSMRQNAADRPSCDELMMHPFITKHGSKFDLTKWLKDRGVTPHHSSSAAAVPTAMVAPVAAAAPTAARSSSSQLQNPDQQQNPVPTTGLRAGCSSLGSKCSPLSDEAPSSADVFHAPAPPSHTAVTVQASHAETPTSLSSDQNFGSPLEPQIRQ